MENNKILAARAQENLDMINDIIGSGMWYMEFNEQGEMEHVVWSQTFRHMLGFTDTNDFPDTLEAWSDRLHPKDKAYTMAAYWDCVAGRSGYDVKYRLMKKNGEYDWFHTHGRIAQYEDGSPRLFLGILSTLQSISGRSRLWRRLIRPLTGPMPPKRSSWQACPTIFARP